MGEKYISPSEKELAGKILIFHARKRQCASPRNTDGEKTSLSAKAQGLYGTGEAERGREGPPPSGMRGPFSVIFTL